MKYNQKIPAVGQKSDRPTGIRLSVGDGIKREKICACTASVFSLCFYFLSGPHDLQSPRTNQHPIRARFKTPGPVHPGLSSHSVSWSGRCLLWSRYGGLSVGRLEPRVLCTEYLQAPCRRPPRPMLCCQTEVMISSNRGVRLSRCCMQSS